MVLILSPIEVMYYVDYFVNMELPYILGISPN